MVIKTFINKFNKLSIFLLILNKEIYLLGIYSLMDR